MIEKIKSIISDEIFNKEIEKENISCILLSSGWYRKAEASRTICIAFINGYPRIVARWYQDPFSSRDFSKEYEVQQRLSTKVNFKVPNPINILDVGGRNVLFENFLYGIPIERLLQGYSGELQPQEAFLHTKRIQDSLDNLSTLSSYDLLKEEMEKIWDDFFAVFEPSVLEELFFEKIKERILNFFKDRKIFKRLSSGDFVCRNILLDKNNNLGLVDYEFAEETHFYFLDWFRFVFCFPVTISGNLNFKDEFLSLALKKEDEDSMAFWALFYIKDFLIKASVFLKELIQIEKKDLLNKFVLTFKDDELWSFFRDEKMKEMENELSLIYSSRSWKVGRIATAPWRWGKKILKRA